MKEITMKIIDEVGLHARPASEMAQLAGKYKSNIIIKCNGREANAKSIITIMALGVKKDAIITVQADGEDEANAIKDIQTILISKKIAA